MRKTGPRVGAYVLCVDDGKILLSRWTGFGDPRWNLPGGGVDHGEDPVDAAVREVFEETGYTAEIDELLGLHSHVRTERSVAHHSLRVLYSGRITGGELTYEVGGSSDMAAWFDLAEVPDLPRVSLVEVALRMVADRPRSGRLG